MTRTTRALAILLAFCLGASAAAQPPRATAVLSDATAFVGEPITLTLELTGVPATLDAPPPPAIRDCTTQFASQVFQPAPVVTINGRRIDQGPDTLLLQYTIQPNRAGSHTVPPIAITLPDGRTLTTNPVTFTAEPTPASTGAELNALLDTTTAYVGQPVTLTLTWTLPESEARNASFGPWSASAPAEVLAAPDPRGGRATPRDDRFIEFELWGAPAVGVWATALDSRGTPRRSLTVRRTIIPRAPGPLTIGPLSITFEEAVGVRPSRSFMFRDQPIFERREASTGPITLEVQPLPTENRPADFTGLVGTLALSSDISARETAVGDPLVLTLTITGDEPLERIDPPDPRPLFAERFRLDERGWREIARAPGSRTFALDLRVADPGAEAVPALEIPYFDPERGVYRTARAEAIPLSIRDTRIVTAADALRAQPGTTARSPLTPGSPGIAAAPATLGSAGARDPLAIALSPAGLAAITAPPGLALALAGLSAWRTRSDPAAQRRAAAARRAVRSLRTMALDATLRGFIADRLDQPAASVSAADADRLGPTARAHLRPLMEQCESARLTGGAEPAPPRDLPVLLRRVAREHQP